jgi:hypothetical protein
MFNFSVSLTITHYFLIKYECHVTGGGTEQ